MDPHREIEHETVQGYLIDIACARKAASEELHARAARHPTECALMGHCIESGFALVDDEGQLHLLEPAASTAVVRHLLATDEKIGVVLLARRERRGDEMHTVDVAGGSPTFGAVGSHVQP